MTFPEQRLPVIASHVPYPTVLCAEINQLGCRRVARYQSQSRFLPRTTWAPVGMPFSHRIGTGMRLIAAPSNGEDKLTSISIVPSPRRVTTRSLTTASA